MKLLGLVMMGVCAAAGQEDVTTLIERLGADTIEERDAATRSLERLGLRAAEPIERALAVTHDPELRARLASLAQVNRKRAEFAKVLGEARRVTIHSQGRALSDVAREVGRALGETVVMEGFDGKETVTIDLRNATLWEALDQLARVGDLHYQYNHWKLVLRKGAKPRLPALYFEQFRVSVMEAKSIEHRWPGAKEAMRMLVLEVRHPRDVFPSADSADDPFELTTFIDASGKDAAGRRPSWGGSLQYPGRPFAIQTVLFVSEKAAGPITLRGTVALPFASDVEEVSLAVAGEGRETRDDSFALRVKGFTPSAAVTRLTLEAEALTGGVKDARRRLNLRDVFLVDAGGIKHRGRWMSGNFGRTCVWEFEFGSEIRRPEKVLFRWVREFHRVEIPFQFQGIAVPDL